MNILLHDKVVVSDKVLPAGSNGVIDFTATAADVKFLFTPARPVDVVRWGYIVTTAKDASSMALTLSHRPVAGSASNKVVIGTITDAAARAAGAVVYQEPGELATDAATQSTAEDGSLRNVAPAGRFHVIPGEELSIELTDVANSTGAGYVFIEYLEYPFAGVDVADAVEITATT